MAKSRKAAEVTIDINANVASLEKNMKKAVGQLDALQNKVARMNRVMTAAFTFDVGKTLLPQLVQLTGVINRLADTGDKASAIKDAFEALGGQAQSIRAAKEAILGAVDSFELMRLANAGLLKDIPKFGENFGLLADYANRVADALGGDTVAAIENVTQALATGKEKQLQAIGIQIDAEKAEKQFANSIGKTSEQLSEAGKLYAKQLAIYDAIKQKLEVLPKPALSVTDGLNQINTAMSEASKLVGTAINDNEDLAKAYSETAKVIASIDWAQLGKSAAEFFSVIVQSSGEALVFLARFFNEFNDGFQLLFGNGVRAGQLQITTHIQELQTELDQLDTKARNNAILGPFSADSLMGKTGIFGQSKQQVEERRKQLQGEIDVAKSALDQLNQQAQAPAVPKLNSELENLIKNIGKSGNGTEDLNGLLKDQANEAKKAAEEIAKLRTKWADFLAAKSETNLKNQIQQQIESATDSSALDGLKEQLARTVEEGFIKEWQQAVDKGALSMGEVADAAKVEGQKAVDEITDDLKKKLEADAKDAADEYRRQFDTAFSDFSATAKGVGDQFGVDLGGILDQLSKNFGGQMEGVVGDLAKSLGLKDVPGGASAASQLMNYGDTGLKVIGDAIAAKEKDKATKSNKGTGEAVGGGIGGAIGSIWGPTGAAIGQQIGKFIGGEIGKTMKWGPQNAESKARHLFANWFEDQLANLDAVSFMNKAGQYTTAKGSMVNFIEGDTTRFNTPGWADSMNEWGGKARTMFEGLGSSLKEMLGITEDVAGQLAFLLGENLAGNIDNARLMVYQLGLSFEDLQEALLTAAKKGSISWREFTIQLAGMSEAFKEGREGTADLKGAWDQFLASGGRGMGALKGIKDIVIEAGEAGAKTLEDLQAAMIGKGISAEDTAAFIKALKEQGYASVEQMKDLSEVQMGAIISSVEGASQTIAEKWKEIGTNLEKIKVDMDSLPTEKDIKVNFKATFDENMQTAKDAGLLSPNGNTNFAEVSTPRVNTQALRVSPSTVGESTRAVKMETAALKTSVNNITIDARGADAGVEQRLTTLMNSYGDVIAQRAANIVVDSQIRGG